MTPDGWCRVDLSDVADQRIEKVVPVETDKRPYVALEHLAQGSPTLIGWSKAGTAASAKTVFCAGDVLFGKLRPYLRKAAPAPFDGLCSTDILPLFSKRTLDTRYLAQLAQWRPLQQHAVATSSGTKMPRTSWAQLGEFRFSLPPLPEQRKIAAILSSVDDAIEKTQAVIDQVQVVKRGLMQELLTRGLPGRHTRFKQTEIGEIPEEWITVSLAECGATVTSGSRGWAKYYSDDGALFIRIANLARNTIRLQLGDARHVALPQGSAEGTRTRVQPGDLVISITADLGMIGVIPQNLGEAYVNQHLALVRLPGVGLRPEFAGYFLTTETARNRFQKLNDSGAKAGLNLPTIQKLTVPQPPRDEQDVIVQILSTTEDRLGVETNKLGGLAVAKAALMSVLFTGELRVTPDTEAA